MPRVTIKSLQEKLRIERTNNAATIAEHRQRWQWYDSEIKELRMLAETEERINRAQHQALQFAEQLIRLQTNIISEHKYAQKLSRKAVKDSYFEGGSVTVRWTSSDAKESK